MTNNIQYDEYRNNPKLRDKNNEWEKIVNLAGDNKTILKKQIYKDPYDYSDNASKEKTFISNRKDLLKQLPNIDQDNYFSNPYKTNLQQERSIVMTDKNQNSSNNNSTSYKLKKEDWFKDKRDCLVKPSKEIGGLNSLQKSLSASNNRKNNLYNMKQLISI
jgi:hypothetical protein